MMLGTVRTTVTLDPDVRQLVERLMATRGLTFKEALNQAVRQGLEDSVPSRGPRTRVAAMGQPRVNLDKALTLAAEMEDQEIIRRLALGK